MAYRQNGSNETNEINGTSGTVGSNETNKTNETVGTEEAIRRWQRFADDFAKTHAEQGDPHKEVLLNPTLLTLLGDVSGKTLLDAGCGEGYLSRMLAKAGAVVTAVDYAPRMLQIAEQRTPRELAITYLHGNCEDLHMLEDGSFELIVSNMVIQDLAHYERAFQEMYRLLTAGGSYIFSITHPCFITPKSGWERSETGAKLHWKVDEYFAEGAYEQRFGSEERMLLFHRTLSSYVNTLIATGFMLEKIVEPTPDEHLLTKYPHFTEDFRCPNFIVFKLRKA